MYEACNFLRRISSRFPICDTSSIRCVTKKTCKIFFSPALHSDAISNGRIKNQRQERVSTHKSAYFIHRLICGAANIQILGAKDVDRQHQISIDPNPIWLGTSFLDRLGLGFSLREVPITLLCVVTSLTRTSDMIGIGHVICPGIAKIHKRYLNHHMPNCSTN